MAKPGFRLLAAGALLACLAAPPALAATLTAPGGGTVHALTMGVNLYPNLPGHSLKGAEPDAEDLYSALHEAGVKDLTPLFDQNVTRAHVIAAMDRLVSTSKAGDLVIITYAGHGMVTPAYPFWHDVDKNGVNRQIALSNFSFSGPNAGEVIVNEEVRAWLSRFDAKGVDVLVVWDSCFGGGMRGVALQGGEIVSRQLHGDPSEEARRNFKGIAMTEREARADVGAMTHITFLAGATPSSVVPEMNGVDPQHPSQPRGALSYYLSRAFRGVAKHDGGLSRGELYEFLAQGVREATSDRQQPEFSPQSESSAITNRLVFSLTEGPPDSASKPVATSSPTASLDLERDPVRLAIVNGPADAASTVEKGQTAIAIVANPEDAELTWDVGGKKAIAHGDVLMSDVDGSLIGEVADRVRALARLRAGAADRPLTFRNDKPGVLLEEGDRTKVTVEKLGGANLVVFNIAADATVQMELPAPPRSTGACPTPAGDQWSCALGAGVPFGVDTLVAVATNQEPTELVEWLKAHHGRHDAAQVPGLLAGILSNDATARIGFIPVVTTQHK